MNWLYAGCCAASLAAAGYLFGGSSPALPDPKLTPGAVRSASVAEICAPGYARAQRPDALVSAVLKEAALRNYGIPSERRGDYEADHLIPICLGGEPISPLNIWPQRWAQAREKDKIEAEVCRAACNYTKSFVDEPETVEAIKSLMAQADADLKLRQRWFAEGGWAK